MNELKLMPKVEIHVHLDGSTRVKTISELSGISVEDVKKEMIAQDTCHDLNDYLTKFKLPIDALHTKESLIRVSRELVEDLEDDGVMYAEVRFAPILHINPLSLGEVVEAVLEGLGKGNIKVKLLLCMMRNASYEENKKVIDLAKKYMNAGVVGIDLAGAEALFKTENFKELFEYARNIGVPFTIHSGEADGASSIKSALSFQTTRLGHGVRLIEDNNLLTEFVEKNILLEVCPSSNIQTRVFDKYSDHSIYELYKKGVKVTVNTDNRTVSNITLTEEYEKLMNAFSFQLDDFKRMNLNAIDGLFLSREEKEKIKEQYLECFDLFLNNSCGILSPKE